MRPRRAERLLAVKTTVDLTHGRVLGIGNDASLNVSSITGQEETNSARGYSYVGWVREHLRNRIPLNDFVNYLGKSADKVAIVVDCCITR